MLFLQKILLLVGYIGWFCGESHHKNANMLYETAMTLKTCRRFYSTPGRF